MPMSTSQLRAVLAAERADALAADQASKLSKERTAAMDYYMGDVSSDIPNVAGRSTAVSSDVADTIEGLMPSLMEIFCGGDEVVKFAPVSQEDVEPAQQETDYVNHVFMQQNQGFLVLYSFIKDALLSKLGVVKVWTELEEKEERETYFDQPQEALDAILADKKLQIIEHTEHDGLHDFTVTCKKQYKRHRAEAIPPEEFGVSRRARSGREVNFNADYCFHESPTTVGALIEQGYDEALVKTLPSEAGSDNTEETARNTVDEGETAGDEGLNEMGRVVKVTNHYIRMDYEGKGKPTLYRVGTGGENGVVLRRNGKDDVERVDYAPFAAMSPVIVTHRIFGRSVADLVMDIMRIKTALLRGMLDNLYLHNNPRVEVSESHKSDQTLDDLLVSRPGGIVRTKAPGGLNWQVVPDITTSVYPALEYFDATREWRTGVTRQGQGIDANALQNQSATAVNQAFTAAQARMKLIARIFAETGIRDLFMLLHAELKRHGDPVPIIKLRNKWVPVDPRQWKTRTDMTIDVGLGTGGKQQQLANLMALINLQAQALSAGKTNLVNDVNLFNSAKEFTKLIGKPDVESFFTDPATQPPPQPPIDPKLLEVQLKDKELQMRGQEMQVQAALDAQADMRKAEIEKVQAQADMVTEDRKLQGEMALAQQKFELEKELKMMEFQLKREEHAAEMEMRRELHQQTLASNAMGMAAKGEQHEQKMAEMKAKPKAKAGKA